MRGRRLVEDTAWHPIPKAEVEKWGPTQAFLYKTFLGSPLKLWASVGHWLIWHFNLDLYTEKQRPRVRARTQVRVISGFSLPPVRGSTTSPGPAREDASRSSRQCVRRSCGERGPHACAAP